MLVPAISTAHNLAAGSAMLGVLVFFGGALLESCGVVLVSLALFGVAVALASTH
jgi:hypothetical protein